MGIVRRPRGVLPRAEALCDRLRGGRGDPAPVLAELRTLGDAAVPAVAALLRERGAGYAFAVRLLAAAGTRPARAALLEAAEDAGANACDRFEAARALDEQGDPSGLPVLRRLGESGALRAAVFYVLRDREGGLEDRDLVLGPWLDDAEVRPLAVETLRARGYETGGALDDPGERDRFRRGWRAGVLPAKRKPGKKRRRPGGA